MNQLINRKIVRYQSFLKEHGFKHIGKKDAEQVTTFIQAELATRKTVDLNIELCFLPHSLIYSK